jgi:hypothetical protein
MRIAVCFFGLAYGYGKASTGRRERASKVQCLTSLKSIQHSIYLKNDCDTYFHAWIDSEERENSLVKVLSPKSYIAEKQIEFDCDAQINDPNLYKKKLTKGPKTLRHSTLSQTYSRTRSLQLAFDAMESGEETYDFIIALRYDLHFMQTIKFETFDHDILYVPHNSKSPATEKYPCDFFFVGNPNAMKYLLNVQEFLQNEIDNGVYKNGPEAMLHRYYNSLPDLKVCRLRGKMQYRVGFCLSRHKRGLKKLI